MLLERMKVNCLYRAELCSALVNPTLGEGQVKADQDGISMWTTDEYIHYASQTYTNKNTKKETSLEIFMTKVVILKIHVL